MKTKTKVKIGYAIAIIGLLIMAVGAPVLFYNEGIGVVMMIGGVFPIALGAGIMAVAE